MHVAVVVVFVFNYLFSREHGQMCRRYSSEGLTTSTGPKRKHIVVLLRDRYLVIHRHLLSVDIFHSDALVVTAHRDARPTLLSYRLRPTHKLLQAVCTIFILDGKKI